MRTWWVIKSLRSSRISHAYAGTYMQKMLSFWGIGPYWTYEEAQRVLDHWTK